MLLRLADGSSTLQVRIHASSRFKSPFFSFRRQDNTHTGLVGAWCGDTYTLPQISHKQFTSVLELFLFLKSHSLNVPGKPVIPQSWGRAFCWTPQDTWDVLTVQPFSTFLQKYGCYVHDEPPYELYFNQCCPKPAQTRFTFSDQFRPRHSNSMSFKHMCKDSWESKTPVPVYTNPHPQMNRQIWKKFLLQHQILSKSHCSKLVGSKPAQPRVNLD